MMKECFDEKWIPEPMSGCWLWIAATSPTGYGLMRAEGKTRRAHRLAYELYVGAIPLGLCILHSCDNPSCVNPLHLRPGTPEDNAADRSRRDRAVKKLTTDQIDEIRSRRVAGANQQSLADAFEVSQAQISRVCAGMRSGRTQKQSSTIRKEWGMTISRM